jgi:hypothetical protein
MVAPLVAAAGISAVGKLLSGVLGGKKSYFSGLQPGPLTISEAAKNLDAQKILTERPDVAAEYQDEASRDWKSQIYLKSMGINSAEDYARWWADKYGLVDQFGGGSSTPTTPTTDIGQTTESTTNTSTVKSLQDTIQSMLAGFNSQVNQAASTQAARDKAREDVYKNFGNSNSKITTDLLGSTIQEVLNGEYGKAQTQLERAKTRKQFNDVGYSAGISELDKQKGILSSKLSTTANDVLNQYRTKYDDVRSEALDYANSFSGTGNFDLTDFLGRANSIVDEARTAAPGAFQGALGNAPLIDLGIIRGNAGQAQGSLNLHDLDVLDALSKRKKVETVGRGIGSQGAF